MPAIWCNPKIVEQTITMRLRETVRTLFSLLRREQAQPEHRPESIVRLLSRVTINGSRLSSGHIHIHVKGFSDHLILRWRRSMFGALTEVAVKSKRHKQGHVSQFQDSEFHDYSSTDVFQSSNPAWRWFVSRSRILSGSGRRLMLLCLG